MDRILYPIVKWERIYDRKRPKGPPIPIEVEGDKAKEVCYGVVSLLSALTAPECADSNGKDYFPSFLYIVKYLINR